MPRRVGQSKPVARWSAKLRCQQGGLHLKAVGEAWVPGLSPGLDARLLCLHIIFSVCICVLAAPSQEDSNHTGCANKATCCVRSWGFRLQHKNGGKLNSATAASVDCIASPREAWPKDGRKPAGGFCTSLLAAGHLGSGLAAPCCHPGDDKREGSEARSQLELQQSCRQSSDTSLPTLGSKITHRFLSQG